MTAAIRIEDLAHRYGDRLALGGLTLTIESGEIFVFLGPNGSGKTTLFRVLSTLIPPQSGKVAVLGHELPAQAPQARAGIGVAFQAPSLDKKLTVAENLACHAALYGLRGSSLRSRAADMLEQLGIADRAHDRVESLSGGLRRRVELAKAMLPRPRLLLLDEPSTGLDPGSRSDLWKYLRRLSGNFGVTVALTSHLLDEADRADRIAILHAGKLAALDAPAALRSSIGGDALALESDAPDALAAAIRERFGVRTSVVQNCVRLEVDDGARWMARLREAFPERIVAVRVGKPTLEDVYIEKTGHRFWRDDRDEGADAVRE